jgi:hypothetical protein
MERRAPAAPSARHPHPQHTIGGRQAKAWAARAIRDRQLMPKGEDLQMQAARERTNNRREWTNETTTDTMRRAYSE